MPETIYQAVYRPDLGGLCRELPKALRTGRLRRKPYRRSEQRRGRLPNMTMIDQRSDEAADRKVAGHWEGDLITGEDNRSAIGTLVERSRRYTILLHLPGRHTADAIRDAVIDAMKDLPAQLRRSLTWDQGSEMALHGEIAAALGMPVYFCEKASPWQRPSNENTVSIGGGPAGLISQASARHPRVTPENTGRDARAFRWTRPQQTPTARLADFTVNTRPGPARVSGRRGTRSGSVPESAGIRSA